MKKRCYFTLVMLGTCVFIVVASFASERIAKQSRMDFYVPPMSGEGSQPAYGNISDSELNDQNSFFAYTVPEIDSMMKSLKDRLKQDEDQIFILRTNNKTLATENDALTKRLNDLEIRLKKLER